MDEYKRRHTQLFINDADTSRLSLPEKPERTQVAATNATKPVIPVKNKLHKTLRFTETVDAKSRRSKPTPPLDVVCPQILVTNFGDPWKEHYTKVLEWHDLGGNMHLAVQRTADEKYVNIREFKGTEAEDVLFCIQQIRHGSFVTALEAFATDNVLYVVLEEMNITLSHVISCSRYPTPYEVVAILGQILDGLVYLNRECFEHTTLSWETVLLNFKGEVKIAYQESCRKVDPESKAWAVAKIGSIARGLINKDEKPVGILRPQWLSYPEAISFVAATTSARSVLELREHQFLALHRREDGAWHKGSLLKLIALAATQAHPRKYHYTE